MAVGFGVIGILLVGCAGLMSSAGHSASHPSKNDSHSRVPSVVVPQSGSSSPGRTASRADYAAVTEVHSQRLIVSLIQLQNANVCTWIRPGAPDLQVGSLTCATAMTHAGRRASGLATTLRASQQTRNGAYLGRPPTSVSGLVNRTIHAADQLHDAGASARGCVVAPGYTCLKPWADFDKAMNQMNLELVAWRPYQ